MKRIEISVKPILDRRDRRAFMVTLKDIAEKAGVSMMTVSRVMNGNQGKVSEKTAARIRALADEMGYIPNSSARSLAANSSKIIAVVLRDLPAGNPLADPYSAAFLGLITREVQKRGYYIMIHFVQDFSDVTFRLRSWNAEGAIFLGLFDEEIRQLQNSNHIPLVFTDSYSNVRQLINIGIDDYKGGELAAEYLIQKGHTSLAFAGPFTRTGGVISKRCQGFSDTIKREHLSLAPEHIYDLDKITPEDLIDSILNDPQPPTGLFAFSDEWAVQLFSIARQKGLSIPEQLSVIGFDDLPVSRALPIALTTIRQDITKKAEETCRLLFEHITAPEKPCESVILDVELVERDSVVEIEK